MTNKTDNLCFEGGAHDIGRHPVLRGGEVRSRMRYRRFGCRRRSRWTKNVASLGWCVLAAMLVLSVPVQAATNCPVSREKLLGALKESVKPAGGPSNGGLDNNEWAAVVDRQGVVCVVVFSGQKPDDQWLASRAIAIEKANTANAMSLKGFALSTANLWGGAQPGAPLYGMGETNPVRPDLIYAGSPAEFGSAKDPLLGKVPGGVVAFGGGLALYNGSDIVGGLGVSGDTSCADHNVAWRVRQKLGLDKVPAGVGPTKDGIIYDVGPNGKSASGYGHPTCNGREAEIAAKIGAGSGIGGK